MEIAVYYNGNITNIFIKDSVEETHMGTGEMDQWLSVLSLQA